MPEQPDVKKFFGPIGESDFYRFACSFYFHQDSLSWSRTQMLFAIEAATLATVFSKRDWVVPLSTAFGSILVFLLWRLILRDWEIREQYAGYIGDFHRALPVELVAKPKIRCFGGRYIMRFIMLFLMFINACSCGFWFVYKFFPDTKIWLPWRP